VLCPGLIGLAVLFLRSASALGCLSSLGLRRLSGDGAWGAGCGVKSSGFRVQGFGSKVEGSECGVKGSGPGIQGLGFRV